MIENLVIPGREKALPIIFPENITKTVLEALTTAYEQEITFLRCKSPEAAELLLQENKYSNDVMLFTPEKAKETQKGWSFIYRIDSQPTFWLNTPLIGSWELRKSSIYTPKWVDIWFHQFAEATCVEPTNPGNLDPSVSIDNFTKVISAIRSTIQSQYL